MDDANPVFFLQLCKFTAPVPHLSVYTGICEAPPCHSQELLPPSPVPPTLPNSAACPSPISVAIDSTPASERKFEGQAGAAPPSGPAQTVGEAEETRAGAPKSRVTLSLSRLLKRGCTGSSVFANLSPKCPAALGGRVQPLSRDPAPQAQPKRIANFFQIKVDIPPECRIYPIESEDEDEDCPAALRGTVKEIICPWESITKHDQAG